MGWAGLLSLVGLVRGVGWRATAFGGLGGVFYTAGGVCDALRWPVIYPGVVRSHEVLHVFDPPDASHALETVGARGQRGPGRPGGPGRRGVVPARRGPAGHRPAG